MKVYILFAILSAIFTVASRIAKKQHTKATFNDHNLLVLIFAVPFVYLYPYVINNADYSLSIGNDFYACYYVYKHYFIDLLADGVFPLWSPSETCGYPFYSNPWPQAFYPLNIFLVIFYWLFGGYSFAAHQLFTIAGISIFAVGLFRWLRSLNIERRAAFFATVVISLSFKITELLRFPNAVHTAAWYPFILWGITLLMTTRRWIFGTLIITFSTVCLLTGGYPYYIYYTIFLFPPYLILLFLPRFRQWFGMPNIDKIVKRLVLLGSSFVVALLMCAPYLYKTKQLLDQTVNRVGNDYEYSTAHLFSPLDSIGSLIYPPAAQTEGWYYMGMISIALIALLLITVFLNIAHKKDTKSLLVFLLLWIATVSYISYGKYSYLFDLMWHYLPAFSGLRVWGRLSIILLPIFALMLAIAYKQFEYLITLNSKETRVNNVVAGQKIRWAYGAYLTTFIFIIGVQIFLIRHKVFDIYYLIHVVNFPYLDNFDTYFFVVMAAIQFVLLVIILKTAQYYVVQPKHLIFIIAVLLLIYNFDVGRIGRYQWALQRQPPSARVRYHLSDTMQKSLTTPRGLGVIVSRSSTFNVAYFENWYYERYTNLLQRNGISYNTVERSTETEPILSLLGAATGKRFYFSEHLNYQVASVAAYLDESNQYETNSTFKCEVNTYTGDYLNVSVTANNAGYFSFIDNWDADWCAKLNGKPVVIDKLFGTFKSIKLPAAGTFVVEFSYEPYRWSRLF